MNVLIISLFGFSKSGRSAKIAMHTFADDSVSVVTTDFNHGRKMYHHGEDAGLPIKLTRLHVPAYERNLSFKRILSHLYFARSLKRYLDTLKEKPDLVYCAMPSSTAAYIAGEYCKTQRIPFIIDVIDLWPDSLIPIVPLRSVINHMVSPWRWLTHKAYKMADYISGESKRYAEVAHQINPSVPYSHTYLGVDYHNIKDLISESKIDLKKPDNEIWIGYAGSLGQSYDFDVILKGINFLQQQSIPYKMWFIGGGEKADYIGEYGEKHNLNIEITGRLEYKDLLKYLSFCDIAVNSFKPGTFVVHSYKFNDYVATGCFILNNLPGETATMIDDYNIGYNFNSRNFNEVLKKSILNWANIKPSLKNSIDKLITEELDTNLIYSRLKENLKSAIKYR